MNVHLGAGKLLNVIAMSIFFGFMLGVFSSSIAIGIVGSIAVFITIHSVLNYLLYNTFNPLAGFKRKTKAISTAGKKEYWRWEYDRKRGGKNE